MAIDIQIKQCNRHHKPTANLKVRQTIKVYQSVFDLMSTLLKFRIHKDILFNNMHGKLQQRVCSVPKPCQLSLTGIEPTSRKPLPDLKRSNMSKKFNIQNGFTYFEHW